MVYIQRFAKKLKGTNLVYLQQLVRVFDGLGTYCKDWAKCVPLNLVRHEEITTTNAILHTTGVLDQLNMHDLERYLLESKIVNKISGYAVKVEASEKGIGSDDGGMFPSASSFNHLTHQDHPAISL